MTLRVTLHVILQVTLQIGPTTRPTDNRGPLNNSAAQVRHRETQSPEPGGSLVFRASLTHICSRQRVLGGSKVRSKPPPEPTHYGRTVAQVCRLKVRRWETRSEACAATPAS